MATANKSVTADELISATVKYSNKDDSARIYDISANVGISNGAVTSFDAGEVRKVQSSPADDGVDAMEGINNVATFSSYGARSLNLYIIDASETEAKTIMDAVYAFMADVKANVSINPVTA